MSYQWDVSATWFDCNENGIGKGACGTCSWNQLGMAYPYLFGHPPNYARCSWFSTIPEMSCGDVVPVFSRCPGGPGWVNIPIVDHGPGRACTCDLPVCYCEPYCNEENCADLSIYRLIDLTKQAFLIMGRPLTEGKMFVSVRLP